jgi:hypothetical protein
MRERVVVILAWCIAACHVPVRDRLDPAAAGVITAALQGLKSDTVYLYSNFALDFAVALDSDAWLGQAPWTGRTSSVRHVAGALWSANRDALPIHEPPSVPGVHIILTNRDVLPQAFTKDWVTYLSRPGFPSRDSAIIEISQMCGGRCGSSDFVVFVREGTTWRRAAVLAGAVY